MIDSKPSKTAPTPMSPEDHLRAQIERLRVQLLEVNKALGLDRDNTENILRITTALRLRAGTGGSIWRNALADCSNALAECIGRDDPRWKVVERANRLLDDSLSSDDDPPKGGTRAVWLTDEQLRKLKSLTFARMYRVGKLVDKWNMRGLATMVDSRIHAAHARRDLYQEELNMLEAMWHQITVCLQHKV